MTILTDKERKDGTAELKSMVDVIREDDVQYFRDKIINGLKRKQSAVSLVKLFKQLELMEDAIKISAEPCLTDE